MEICLREANLYRHFGVDTNAATCQGIDSQGKLLSIVSRSPPKATPNIQPSVSITAALSIHSLLGLALQPRRAFLRDPAFPLDHPIARKRILHRFFM